MYGQAGAGTASPQTPPKREQVSDIQNETIQLFEASLRSLDHLIAKTLGPRPAENVSELAGPPSLMQDAKRLNILGHQIQARLEELHQSIGHEKQ